MQWEKKWRISLRRTDSPSMVRIVVRASGQRLPFVDVVALDQYDARFKTARTLAARFKQKVEHALAVIDEVYEEWRQAVNMGYTARLLANSSAETAPAAFLIDPLLPMEAVTILVGDGGVGKSACALALASAWLYQQTSPLTARPLPERPVWHYYDWEGILDSVFDWRCRTIENGYRRAMIVPESHPLMLSQRGVFYQVKVSLFEFVENLYSFVQTDSPQLVVIDSLSAAVSGSLNDEKIARDVMQMLTELARIGCAVLVIAHVAKEEARTKNKVGPFGSRMYYNMARQVLELTPAENAPNQYEIAITKNNYGPRYDQPVRYTLDWSRPFVRFGS